MPDKTPKIQLLEALKMFQEELDKRFLQRSPEYNIEKLETPNENSSNSYQLTKDEEQIGDFIDIPEIPTLSSIEFKTLGPDDPPIDGVEVGEKYLDFEMLDSKGEPSHVVMPQNALVEMVADTAPRYNLLQLDNNDANIYKKFSLQKNEENIGNTIDIPNQKTVNGVEVKTVTTKNQPVNGYKVGEQYIDFSMVDANGATSHVYLAPKDFADSAPKYNLAEIANNDPTIYKKFRLVKDNLAIGDTILIPNQTSVSNIEVKTVSTANEPVVGYKVGEQYVEFTVTDVNNSPSQLYLNPRDFSDTLPQYTVIEVPDPPEGFSKSYSLTKDGVALGSTINIPYATFMKSAVPAIAQEDNIPVEGIKAGEQYIDFITNGPNGEDSHIYLGVKELIPAISMAVHEGNGNVITSLAYVNGKLVPYREITALQATDLNTWIIGDGNVFTDVSYNPLNKRFTFYSDVEALQREDFEEISAQEIAALWSGGN